MDETVKVWDLSTGDDPSTLRGHQNGVSAVAFAPDGRTLVSAGGDVRLWRLASQQ